MDKKRIITVIVGLLILATVSFGAYKLFSSKSTNNSGSNTPTSCVKKCDNKTCGDNGCGGTCGDCKSNETCINGKCTPNCGCDGKECGMNDGCDHKCCPRQNDPNYDCSSCQCKDDYYNNNGTCAKCPDNSNPNSFKTGCDCVDTYYMKDGNCVQCPSPATIVNDKKDGCICLQPYYEKDGQYFRCPDNSTSKNCQSCVCNDGYFMSGNTCVQCEPNSHSNDDRTSCVCNDGFYKDSNGVCQPCPKHSKSNSDNTGCICDPNWYGDNCEINCDPKNNCNWKDNKPICNKGFYTKNTDEPVYCESQCNIGASGDPNNPNKCICPENSNNFSDGSCQCNVGFYFDGSKCVSKTGKCNNKGTYNETTKKCDCNQNYYGDTCTEECSLPGCKSYSNGAAVCNPDYTDINVRDPNDKDITQHCTVHCITGQGTVYNDKCICSTNKYVGSDCSIPCKCDPNNTNSVQLSPDGKSCVCVCKDGYGCSDCSVDIKKRCNYNGTWNCDTKQCECDTTKDLLPNCQYCCSKNTLSKDDVCAGKKQGCGPGDGSDPKNTCNSVVQGNCTDDVTGAYNAQQCYKNIDVSCEAAVCNDGPNGPTFKCSRKPCPTDPDYNNQQCQKLNCPPGQMCKCGFNQNTGDIEYRCGPFNQQSSCDNQNTPDCGSGQSAVCSKFYYLYDQNGQPTNNLCSYIPDKSVIFDVLTCPNPSVPTVNTIYDSVFQGKALNCADYTVVTSPYK